MKNNLRLSKGVNYEWNPAVRAKVARTTDVKLIVSELRQIEKIYGQVNPHHLVEASKDENSLLHNYFEWDNDKAAHSWRIIQARLLLGSIQVKIIKSGKPVRMQAYQITKQSGPKQGESIYTKFDAITEDNLVYIQKDAIRLLSGIKNKLEAHELAAALPYIKRAITVLQKSCEPIKIKARKSK